MATTPDTAPDKSSTWESIITTTPVVLTIVGTLLAGLSSSEMTQAQYHRSLAAQNQSKVGDQWNFFQAKRIRGQNLEAGVDLLPVVSKPGIVTPDMIQASATRLVQQLERGQKNAIKLQEAVGKAENGLGSSGGPLGQAAANLVKVAADDAKKTAEARDKLVAELKKPEVKDAFAYLGTNKLPQTKDVPVEDPKIDEVLVGIEERKPESELAPVILRIDESSLQHAIASSEGNARAFELAGKPVNQVLISVDRLVSAETRRAAAFHHAVGSVELALADVPEGDSKALAEVRSAADAVLRSDTAVKNSAEELSTLFKAARNDYNARRYNQEGRYNQRSAGLLEIEVRKNSVASDRHRTRSKQFFYGMLLAQAGVAIASMALAARQKSVLWALASVAGVTAVGFSLYVYLSM